MRWFLYNALSSTSEFSNFNNCIHHTGKIVLRIYKLIQDLHTTVLNVVCWYGYISTNNFCRQNLIPSIKTMVTLVSSTIQNKFLFNNSSDHYNTTSASNAFDQLIRMYHIRLSNSNKFLKKSCSSSKQSCI